MKISLCAFLIALLINWDTVFSQKYITRDIKSFGAKGDGKTNDHQAFEKAASFFSQRGGNGELTIGPGTFIVGNQTFSAGKGDGYAYTGKDVLHFVNIRNFKISGSSKSVIKYADSLRFGSFVPETGKRYSPSSQVFVNNKYAGVVGNCLYFDNCTDISVSNLELNGNSKGLIVGGMYGEAGIQLQHNGIFINNSRRIVISLMHVHDFGCDGITLSNKAAPQRDGIVLMHSKFDYNARQGLSWVGGNDLKASDCGFNHTGKGKFFTSPGAGVDFEPEKGPIRNGIFDHCEFIDNAGNGIVADSGDTRDCSFTDCTFWGTTSWSIWITRPAFTLTNCNIYGSFAHGFNADNDRDATTFLNCRFEDKSYNGLPPYGNFLIESNNRKRVAFKNCTFTANHKKLCWLTIEGVTKPEEKYQLINCSFILKTADYPEFDFIAVVRSCAMKNCTFDFIMGEDTKKKRLNLGGYTEVNNADLGGNKLIFH